jgi:hypothetical protein
MRDDSELSETTTGPWRFLAIAPLFILATALLLGIAVHVPGRANSGSTELAVLLERAGSLPLPEGPIAMERILRERLDPMAEEELRKLSTADSPSVAVSSMWVLAQDHSRGRFVPEDPFGLPAGLTRVLGVPVPVDWEAEFVWFSLPTENLRQVAESYFGKGARCIRRSAPHEFPSFVVPFIFHHNYQKRQPSRADETIQVEPDTDMIVGGNEPILTQGSLRVRCPRELLERLPRQNLGRNLTAWLGPDVSFVAMHDDEGESYNLLAVDSRSGAIKWRALVWACHPNGAPYYPSAPARYHNVHLACSKKSVVVFGNVNVRCYAEAFSVEDGKVQLRFATDRWNVRDGSWSWRQRMTAAVSKEAGW